MSKRVKNKIALLTGAGSGIGAATAHRIAQEGAFVVVTDINEKSGKKVVREIIAKGFEATFLKLDVTKEAQWRQLASHMDKKFKKLDILVNNAGVFLLNQRLVDTSLKVWRQTLAVNLDGVFLGTKYAIPLLEKSGGGSIVNVSSMSAKVGLPIPATSYCASKGGVLAFTKAIAIECAQARNNIRVNCVCPGYTKTALCGKDPDWIENIQKRNGKVDKLWQEIADTVPLKRVATPEEIAGAISYLVSYEARYMTGSELIIDGGYTAE